MSNIKQAACLSACHTQVYVYTSALIFIYNLDAQNGLTDLISKKKKTTSAQDQYLL